MTTKRTDADTVEAYTRALMEAAAAEGRSARDLQMMRHAVKFSPETLKTLAAMVDNGQGELIGDVYREFKDRLDEGDITISVDVTTAVPMDDELRDQVRKKCEHDFQRPVFLVEHVEPKIIGGIIIEARGSRRDASVKTHLVNIRKKLSSSYIGGDE